jgi:ADP-ribosylglycohydrolase
MFTKEKINEIILATFVADSYGLGSHWVYDEKQLQELDVDWDALNAPCALWHKGKVAGDFTHVGDQAYWLREFLKDKNSFNAQEYLKYWQENMVSYDGYIDGASRETLANIQAGNPVGSGSHDFSVIGRIASLLLVSKDENQWIQNVEDFVKLSHNNEQVLEAAHFFATLLFRVRSGENIEEAMGSLKDQYSDFVQKNVENGMASKDKDTFLAIREFGPACSIDEGFSGIVHLLCKYPHDLKELFIQNAKAGGDTSSRAMAATMILTANSSSKKIPERWFKINKR